MILTLTSKSATSHASSAKMCTDPSGFTVRDPLLAVCIKGLQQIRVYASTSVKLEIYHKDL